MVAGAPDAHDCGAWWLMPRGIPNRGPVNNIGEPLLTGGRRDVWVNAMMPCEYCGADAGQLCVTDRGRLVPRHKMHMNRYIRFNRLEWEPPLLLPRTTPDGERHE